MPPPPPPYSLPPFSFTYAGPLSNLQGNTQTNQPIVTNIAYGGQMWALMSFEIDVQPVLNPLPNSSGVDYEITELSYIDVYGNPVNLNYIPGGGSMSPTYNLVGGTGPNIFNYVFQNGITNMSNFTTPYSITASVLFGSPMTIDGIIFLNPPTGINGTGWPIDITCTVTATDSGAITTTHTEILSVTV